MKKRLISIIVVFLLVLPSFVLADTDDCNFFCQAQNFFSSLFERENIVGKAGTLPEGLPKNINQLTAESQVLAHYSTINGQNTLRLYTVDQNFKSSDGSIFKNIYKLNMKTGALTPLFIEYDNTGQKLNSNYVSKDNLDIYYAGYAPQDSSFQRPDGETDNTPIGVVQVASNGDVYWYANRGNILLGITTPDKIMDVQKSYALGLTTLEDDVKALETIQSPGILTNGLHFSDTVEPPYSLMDNDQKKTLKEGVGIKLNEPAPVATDPAAVPPATRVSSPVSSPSRDNAVVSVLTSNGLEIKEENGKTIVITGDKVISEVSSVGLNIVREADGSLTLENAGATTKIKLDLDGSVNSIAGTFVDFNSDSSGLRTVSPPALIPDQPPPKVDAREDISYNEETRIATIGNIEYEYIDGSWKERSPQDNPWYCLGLCDDYEYETPMNYAFVNQELARFPTSVQPTSGTEIATGTLQGRDQQLYADEDPVDLFEYQEITGLKGQMAISRHNLYIRQYPDEQKLAQVKAQLSGDVQVYSAGTPEYKKYVIVKDGKEYTFDSNTLKSTATPQQIADSFNTNAVAVSSPTNKEVSAIEYRQPLWTEENYGTPLEIPVTDDEQALAKLYKQYLPPDVVTRIATSASAESGIVRLRGSDGRIYIVPTGKISNNAAKTATGIQVTSAAPLSSDVGAETSSLTSDVTVEEVQQEAPSYTYVNPLGEQVVKQTAKLADMDNYAQLDDGIYVDSAGQMFVVSSFSTKNPALARTTAHKGGIDLLKKGIGEDNIKFSDLGTVRDHDIIDDRGVITGTKSVLMVNQGVSGDVGTKVKTLKEKVQTQGAWLKTEIDGNRGPGFLSATAEQRQQAVQGVNSQQIIPLTEDFQPEGGLDVFKNEKDELVVTHQGQDYLVRDNQLIPYKKEDTETRIEVGYYSSQGVYLSTIDEKELGLWSQKEVEKLRARTPLSEELPVSADGEEFYLTDVDGQKKLVMDDWVGYEEVRLNDKGDYVTDNGPVSDYQINAIRSRAPQVIKELEGKRQEIITRRIQAQEAQELEELKGELKNDKKTGLAAVLPGTKAWEYLYERDEPVANWVEFGAAINAVEARLPAMYTNYKNGFAERKRVKSLEAKLRETYSREDIEVTQEIITNENGVKTEQLKVYVDGVNYNIDAGTTDSLLDEDKKVESDDGTYVLAGFEAKLGQVNPQLVSAVSAPATAELPQAPPTPAAESQAEESPAPLPKVEPTLASSPSSESPTLTPHQSTAPSKPVAVTEADARYEQHGGYGYWVSASSKKVYTGNGEVVPGVTVISDGDFDVVEGYEFVDNTEGSTDIQVKRKAIATEAPADVVIKKTLPVVTSATKLAAQKKVETLNQKKEAADKLANEKSDEMNAKSDEILSAVDALEGLGITINDPSDPAEVEKKLGVQIAKNAEGSVSSNDKLRIEALEELAQLQRDLDNLHNDYVTLSGNSELLGSRLVTAQRDLAALNSAPAPPAEIEVEVPSEEPADAEEESTDEDVAETDETPSADEEGTDQVEPETPALEPTVAGLTTSFENSRIHVSSGVDSVPDGTYTFLTEDKVEYTSSGGDREILVRQGNGEWEIEGFDSGNLASNLEDQPVKALLNQRRTEFENSRTALQEAIRANAQVQIPLSDSILVNDYLDTIVGKKYVQKDSELAQKQQEQVKKIDDLKKELDKLKSDAAIRGVDLSTAINEKQAAIDAEQEILNNLYAKKKELNDEKARALNQVTQFNQQRQELVNKATELQNAQIDLEIAKRIKQDPTIIIVLEEKIVQLQEEVNELDAALAENILAVVNDEAIRASLQVDLAGTGSGTTPTTTTPAPGDTSAAFQQAVNAILNKPNGIISASTALTQAQSNLQRIEEQIKTEKDPKELAKLEKQKTAAEKDLEEKEKALTAAERAAEKEFEALADDKRFSEATRKEAETKAYTEYQDAVQQQQAAQSAAATLRGYASRESLSAEDIAALSSAGIIVNTNTLLDKEGKFNDDAAKKTFNEAVEQLAKVKDEEAKKFAKQAATKKQQFEAIRQANGRHWQGPSAGVYAYSFITQVPKYQALSNAIFGSEDWYKEWRNTVESSFAPLYLGQSFTAAICDSRFDIETQGTGASYVEVPGGSVHSVASIQAERSIDNSQYITCHEEDPCASGVCKEGLCYDNEDSTIPQVGYFYKITWGVTAPSDISFTQFTDEARQEVDFNLYLYDSTHPYSSNHHPESGKPLFHYPNTNYGDVNTIHLGLGNSSAQLQLPRVIVDFSQNEYTKACIVYGDNQMKSSSGSTIITETCADILPSSLGVVNFENGVTSSGSSPSSTPSSTGVYAGMD